MNIIIKIFICKLGNIYRSTASQGVISYNK